MGASTKSGERERGEGRGERERGEGRKGEGVQGEGQQREKGGREGAREVKAGQRGEGWRGAGAGGEARGGFSKEERVVTSRGGGGRRAAGGGGGIGVSSAFRLSLLAETRDPQRREMISSTQHSTLDTHTRRNVPPKATKESRDHAPTAKDRDEDKAKLRKWKEGTGYQRRWLRLCVVSQRQDRGVREHVSLRKLASPLGSLQCRLAQTISPTLEI